VLSNLWIQSSLLGGIGITTTFQYAENTGNVRSFVYVKPEYCHEEGGHSPTTTVEMNVGTVIPKCTHPFKELTRNSVLVGSGRGGKESRS
jgi:hypothetical protein